MYLRLARYNTDTDTGTAEIGCGERVSRRDHARPRDRQLFAPAPQTTSSTRSCVCTVAAATGTGPPVTMITGTLALVDATCGATKLRRDLQWEQRLTLSLPQ